MTEGANLRPHGTWHYAKGGHRRMLNLVNDKSANISGEVLS